jgi:hypothetical protein
MLNATRMYARLGLVRTSFFNNKNNRCGEISVQLQGIYIPTVYPYTTTVAKTLRLFNDWNNGIIDTHYTLGQPSFHPQVHVFLIGSNDLSTLAIT